MKSCSYMVLMPEADVQPQGTCSCNKHSQFLYGRHLELCDMMANYCIVKTCIYKLRHNVIISVITYQGEGRGGGGVLWPAKFLSFTSMQYCEHERNLVI